MTEYEKAVERRARAIADVLIRGATDDGFCLDEDGWDSCNDDEKALLHKAARATLDADDADGFVLVPRELTNRMLENGGQYLPPRLTLTECYMYFKGAWAEAIAAGAIRRDEK